MEYWNGGILGIVLKFAIVTEMGTWIVDWRLVINSDDLATLGNILNKI